MSIEQSKKRTWIFEEAPIPEAVFTMAIPTIITQLINIVYNFADAWYVGRTGSAAMMAALSVSLPIFIIIQALANLFGIGGASAISRALGRRDAGRARKIFAISLFGGLAAAVDDDAVDPVRENKEGSLGREHADLHPGEVRDVLAPDAGGIDGDVRVILTALVRLVVVGLYAHDPVAVLDKSGNLRIQKHLRSM
jgi:hypothetical protein